MANRQSQQILSTLEQLHISYRLAEHAYVHSMDDLPPIEQELGAQFFRNLFLCNRQQTEFFLLLIARDKPFRTAEVSKKIGRARLSFGSKELLEAMLAVEPGAVNPLSLLFDRGHKIHLLVDDELRGWQRACMHPGDNTQSLVMETNSLFEVFLPHVGYEPQFLTITGQAVPEQ